MMQLLQATVLLEDSCMKSTSVCNSVSCHIFRIRTQKWYTFTASNRYSRRLGLSDLSKRCLAPEFQETIALGENMSISDVILYSSRSASLPFRA